jgi:WD40 repeat protein
MTDNRPLPGFSLLQTLSGHTKVIYECAWSPDGRSLVSIAADRMIRLWQAKSGKLIQSPLEHDAFIFGIAWSPDGRYLASGSFDKGVRVTYSGSGKLAHTLMEHGGPVFSVSWSADGRYLASASDDKTIRLWDSKNKWRSRVLTGHTDWVLSVACAPNGSRLASASRDKSIKLWDMEGGLLLGTLKGHADIVNSVSWSADGRWLASASDDKTVRIWNPDSQRQVIVLEGHQDGVLSVRFSADGRLLASKSTDGTVQLWRCDTWKPVATLHELVKSDLCNGLAFHPKERQLMTLSDDQQSIRIWQLDYATLLGDQSVTQWQAITCPMCGERLPAPMLRHRYERGHATITCPVCESVIPLADEEDVATIVAASRQFDVYLCYSDADKRAVRAIEQQLKQHNIQLWQPQLNTPSPEALAMDMANVHTLAVFVGNKQTPWQNKQTAELIRQVISRPNSKIVFVFLPNSPYLSRFPANIQWVDFRQPETKPVDQLIQMIRGDMVAGTPALAVAQASGFRINQPQV